MEIPKSMVLRAAEYMYSDLERCVYAQKMGAWSDLDAPSKLAWLRLAEPILNAAFAGVEVVGENDTTEDEVFWGWNGSTHTIRPGDAILILRAGGEGEA